MLTGHFCTRCITTHFMKTPLLLGTTNVDAGQKIATIYSLDLRRHGIIQLWACASLRIMFRLGLSSLTHAPNGTM